MVEQLSCKEKVESSSLSFGTTPLSSSGQDSRFSFYSHRFESVRGYHGTLAQRLEQLPHKELVGGSNPLGPTIVSVV